MKKSLLKIGIILFVILSLFCSCFEYTQSGAFDTSSEGTASISETVFLSLMDAWNEKEFNADNVAVAKDFKINDITFSQNSDDNVYLATNYGVFASCDGAKTFSNSAVGIYSKNVDIIEQDPNNENCFIAVCVSGNSKKEALGIYISETSLQGFKKTSDFFVPVNNSKIQLVFDPSSYKNNKSSIIYLTGLVSINDGVSVYQNALYRSLDGGNTFTFVRAIQPNCEISVHPTKGYLYLADNTGFYRSIDHGDSFEVMTGGSNSHVFVSKEDVNKVLLAGVNGMIISNNSGETFESTAGVVPRMGTAIVSASQLNQTNIVAHYKNYDKTVSVEFSNDGGVTWLTSFVENHLGNYYPKDEYQVDLCWSNVNPNVVLMVYNNYIYKSENYGETFNLLHNSIKGFDIKSKVFSNSVTPQYKSFVIGEDTVAISYDDGDNYKLFELDIKETEHLVSVYPISRTTSVVIIANNSTSTYAMALFNSDTKIMIRSSADELKTHTVLGDASDKNLIFAGNYYSVDAGKNWIKLNGCDGVLAQNPYSPGELFGISDGKVVMSVDKGRNWVELFSFQGNITDMTYDYFEKNLYFITNTELYKYTNDKQLVNCTDNIPLSFAGERKITFVKTDLSCPGRVYIGGYTNEYVTNTSVMVTNNSAESWYIINATPSNKDTVIKPYGIQPFDITVDFATGVVTTYCGMYGIYQFNINQSQLN